MVASASVAPGPDVRRAVLLVSVLSAFLNPFAGSSVGIALPTISRDLGMDAVSMSWVSTIFLLVSAMFLVPFGRLADIYGRKRLFLIGMTIFSIAYLLSGLAPSGTFLIAFRALQGFGGSMVFGTSISILTSVYPPHERGRVLGLTLAFVYLGSSIGPFTGGLITDNLGWRGLFLLLVPLTTMIVLVTKWKLKGEWAEARGEHFDAAGSAIYCVTLLLIMYGLSLLPASTGLALLILGLVGLVIFIIWEARIVSPVLDVKLFRNNRVFAFSNIAALINYLATFAVGFLLSLHLQFIAGFSAGQAGLLLIIQPIVQMIFSPIAGRLSDKVDARIIATSGMALTFAGLLVFAFMDGHTPLSLITANLVMMGLGFALFASPNTNALMNSVERRYYGVASATATTMRVSGQMLGMGITMLLFALIIGPVQITPEYYGQFIISEKTAFTIFSSLCLFGIFASLTRGRPNTPTTNQAAKIL